MRSEQLLPGIWRFEDTCNVYVIRRGEGAVAVDFGSGRWMESLPRLGVRRLEHVLLTHHHADQCHGLTARKHWPFTIHAPAGEQAFLDPQTIREVSDPSPAVQPVPASYAAPQRGIHGVRYDIAGFSDFFWGNQRLRFLHTPGHGPNACSVLMDHAGRQVLFCGDAAHAGGTLHEPYHLEWDHWTGIGALAAWAGVTQLAALGIDVLCPSHGPIVRAGIRAELKRLAERLMRFYQAKGSICAGEKDGYLTPEITRCGAFRILPHLYLAGKSNCYLLTSNSGEALVVDPHDGAIPALEQLLVELRHIRPTAIAVSHSHLDHCNGVDYLRKHYGARLYLHPKVAEPLQDFSFPAPYRPAKPIHADILWPERGKWTFHEYDFRVDHWPGQTWWHCAFFADIDGKRVLFGGDSFQPASRWNGTGGFCAFNRSRFAKGFALSARKVLKWKPDIIAAGHQTFYAYRPAHFRKIIRWTRFADKAVRDLCPSGDIERDYYSVVTPQQRRIGRFLWKVR